MAVKVAEAWVSSDGTVVAVKKQSGGYLYFVNGRMTINRQEIQSHPFVASKITALNLEIMEANYAPPTETEKE